MSIMRTDGWLGVELRHLAALQAVSEEGSFGRAAERLGYTQSAVSQQIQALERIVGAQLVERPGGPRRVSLTEAGELLLRHAAGIVARLQAAQADMAAFAEGSAGTLRVGTYQSVGARVLPRLLREFTTAWPDVAVQLTESADDGGLLELVERGELDFTFVMLPAGEGPFESVELMRDPYVAVLPADSPLATRPKPPSLRELAAMPLIGNRQCRSVHQIENRFHDAGLEPRIVFRSDDNGTIQELVAAGVGVALVPLLTVDPSHDGTAVIALAGVPPRRIGIAWHRDRYRSPAARAFVELAQAVGARSRPTSPAPPPQRRAYPATRRPRWPARARSRPRSAPACRPARRGACCPPGAPYPREAAVRVRKKTKCGPSSSQSPGLPSTVTRSIFVPPAASFRCTPPCLAWPGTGSRGCRFP